MDCREVRQQLELAVLDELPASQKTLVEAHLESCAECRAVETEYRLLLREVRLTARTAAPGIGLERAVRAAVRAELHAERRRRWVARCAVGVAAAALLLVVVAAVYMTWPAGTAPEVTGGHPPAAGVLGERWQYKAAQGAAGSIAEGILVQGRRVYLLRREQRGACVTAVDAATGEALWQCDTQSIGYLAADGERVFSLASVRPRTVELVALDASDGRPLWRHSEENLGHLTDPSQPVPLAGNRVCWTTDSTVHMLDSRTGEAMWRRSIEEGGPLSAVAVEGDKAYVASASALHCLNVESGEELWAVGLDKQPSAHGRPLLAVARGRVHVAQPRGRLESQLSCLSADTRRPVWTKVVPRVRYVLASAEALYSRNQDDIRAFDGDTGETLWTCKAGGCSPLTHVDGLVYFVDTDARGGLVALNGRTGAKVWEMSRMRSCEAFARVGDTGYIKTSDGVVHALALCSTKQY